jgi:hypothetical protein
VRPIAWEEFTVADDDHTITIRYFGGVPSCYGPERVDTLSAVETVTITIYEGQLVRTTDQGCPSAAVVKEVAVRLPEPLGGRSVIDGATNRS